MDVGLREVGQRTAGPCGRLKRGVLLTLAGSREGTMPYHACTKTGLCVLRRRLRFHVFFLNWRATPTSHMRLAQQPRMTRAVAELAALMVACFGAAIRLVARTWRHKNVPRKHAIDAVLCRNPPAEAASIIANSAKQNRRAAPLVQPHEHAPHYRFACAGSSHGRLCA